MKMFKTDMICTKCGTINVVSLRGHQRKKNGEATCYCYKCQKDVTHIIVGDIDVFAKIVGLPKNEVIKLIKK